MVVHTDMYLLVHSYLSKVAQSDIERIFCQKIDDKGIWLAWMEMEAIRERIDSLSAKPQQGYCRDELWRGVLCVRHDEYIIYFRRTESQLGVDILALGSVDDDPNFSHDFTRSPDDFTRTDLNGERV